MIDSPPDYRALSFWALCLGQLVSAVVWVAGWLSLRKKATADEIRALSDQFQASRTAQSESCSKHQARTTTLEVQAKNVPTHADLGAVYDRISLIKGTTDEMNGRLKSIGTQVGMLVSHHIDQSKK